MSRTARASSTTPAPVQQITLPGQAAAPDGPVDLTAMFVMHHAFRRDLSAFVAAAEHTPLEDRTAWRALHRRWGRLAMVLHHHHAGEDAGIWPLLLTRAGAAGDTAAVATLEAMEAEHEEIDPVLEGCAGDLAVLAARPDADAREAFRLRAVSARERLGQHLAHEERDALALVQRFFSPADWLDVERRHFHRTATPGYLVYVVPWAMHRLPRDARTSMATSSGRTFVVLERLLRPAFLRLERAAFRHVPTDPGDSRR